MKRLNWARELRLLLVLTTVLVVIGTHPSMVEFDVHAQIPPAVKFDVPAASGLTVSPVYEGWYEMGGAKYALFGYYNRNQQQIVDVPIGPQNHISPGPPDQGQPTHFLPGNDYGVFAVRVPKDPPNTEVTWTLTANGQTFSIPANMDPLYILSPLRETGGAYPGNTPPVLKFDPTGASSQGPYGIVVNRTANVGRPLTLDVLVTDDGLPPPPPEKGPASRPRTPTRQDRFEGGVNLSWEVYRGSGAVRVSDKWPRVEQGKVSTTVTFSEPGDYMLHLVAIDSRTANRCCWTNAYVKVVVSAAS